MERLYITRQLEEVIAEAVQYFSVISVTGPRQSGKSTLLKHMFPDYRQYSMKDVNVREFAENDPIAFLNQTHGGMFIDEVQKVPALLEYIQGIVDNNPERKFLLTGSSNLELLGGLSESLPGRAGVFELLPMSYGESREQQEGKDTNQLLYDGLYPAICAGKNKASLFYPSYVKTYIEKDVRDLLKVKNMMQFMKFMRLCAARVGSLFNASEVANEVGVDSKTVTQWLSVLQASYLVTWLPPYYENITKRLVKTPKLYFNDPGLACCLLDIENPKQLDRDKMRGAIFENYIVMEILKHRYNQGRAGGVYFYRDSNSNEVDILLKQGGEKSLKQIGSWIGTPVIKKIVVYTGEFENTAGDIKIVNYRNLDAQLQMA